MAKRLTKQPNTTIIDLPEETLLMILKRLDDRDHSSLLIVSKLLSSLADRFVHKLYFNKSLPKSDSAFSRLFTRFSSVRQIAIRSNRFVQALIAISNSGLDIELLEIQGKPRYPKPDDMIRLSGRLGMIKGLQFKWFSNVSESQVVEFIHMFSCLEELDLSDCRVWSDNGIELLALNAPNLRIIDLSMNKYLTDRSLVALSNCVNLEKITFLGCDRITARGICTLLRTRRNLKWLSLPYSMIVPMHEVDMLANTVSSCENLSDLAINFEARLVTDVTLSVIAKSGSPLTSLEIASIPADYTNSYTMTGVSAMLCAFQGLSRIYIHLPYTELDTQDMDMSQLVKSLHSLEVINIVSCYTMYATLFSLIQNCPLLERISLRSYYCNNTQCDLPESIRRNYTIQVIHLRPEPDALLINALESICPGAEICTN